MFKMIFLILSLYSYANANSYKDMFEKDIEIKKVDKIYASTPTILYSLYAIDKSKIAGLNFPFNKVEAIYIDETIKSLPIIGGWFGKGNTPNSEMILKINPDVILLSETSKNQSEKRIRDSLGNINTPFFYIKANSIEDIINSFSYLGKLTSNEKRAKELENYAKKVLDEAKELSKKVKEKPRVYYAQGNNGLETECDKSIRSELITLASGDNVHKCQNSNTYGKELINFEKVLSYNPEIILVYEKEFYKKVYSDPKWQFIDAVKNKKVYFLPKGPFSWFDRPPSFMKILGLKWLLNILHSNSYEIDINKDAKEFYSLFLGLELSNIELNHIMGKDIE
ncbi:ABC transporter substrate-binding protein [Aliarcobacter trophiarum]|uniref:ABC transporter substrate-binding protein n=1 Tax=Aliarcobacter trophiarum TaxID=708186 RepID=UPI00100AAE49|nr:ABC transporter substrate-binding protein [Aliarcobacter trophiarum]RXI28114.1 ABC transporter substrate-binding protein [Aliarcobacter trophiarum]